MKGSSHAPDEGKYITMQFRNRVKRARRRLGLSQSEAAREWGISVKTLQGWEREKFSHEPRGFIRAHIERVLAKAEGREV
jgi:DNA-binding transcriptional regulator YiaG